MSLINVTDVQVLDNPTKFTNQFQFEITFECLPPGVQEELEWKLTYVGSATDEKYDQELDSVLVGPVIIGKNKFLFNAPPPDPTLIPKEDIMEVTVLLLTACYKEKEFIRIGYYVNTEINPQEVALCAERDEWLGRCTSLQQQHQEILQQIRAQQESLDAAANAANAAAAAAGQAPPPEAARVVLPTPPEPTMPPAPAIDISKLQRNILADKPRVTRFTIHWDEPVASRKEYTMDAEDEAKAASDAAAENASGAAAGADADAAEDDEEDSEDDEADGDMDDVTAEGAGGEGEALGEEGEDAGEEEGEEEEEEPMNNQQQPAAGSRGMEA